MSSLISKVMDLCTIVCLWTLSFFTTSHATWQFFISATALLLTINTVRLHSISNQCEADSETLYDYVFGLKTSRDCLIAQNAALARLIARRDASISKTSISKKRRNGSATDLRQCVATRIVSHGKPD
jgi:hypothetical protein